MGLTTTTTTINHRPRGKWTGDERHSCHSHLESETDGALVRLCAVVVVEVFED